MEKFKSFVDAFQKDPNYRQPLGFGIARVDIGKCSQKVLCATYPLLNWQGENLGTYAVLSYAAKQADSLISQNENESVYGINEVFLHKTLELYDPFLNESLNNDQTHKNIQVILELLKVAKKKKLNTCNGEAKYRFCVLYADSVCQSVESA